jgi:hypothetical protein
MKNMSSNDGPDNANPKLGVRFPWAPLRLLIANHLDESLQKANQKDEQQSEHIYYTLLCQVLCFAACASLSKSCKNAKAKNHFSEPSQHDVTCLHPILICRVTYWASEHRWSCSKFCWLVGVAPKVFFFLRRHFNWHIRKKFIETLDTPKIYRIMLDLPFFLLHLNLGQTSKSWIECHSPRAQK